MKNANVLVHFDPAMPVVLACDAYPVGIGTWIGHVMPNGQTRAILHASRTLTPSERNYSQICREGLAVIFGVKKFHEYLYGRHFTLISDCKPLCSIFGPKKSIPQMIAGRLQRWAIILSAYDYEIKCIKSGDNCLADSLSRLSSVPAADKKPVFYSAADDAQPAAALGEQNAFAYFIESNTPISYTQIAAATKKDRVLSKVLGYIIHGWPTQTLDVPDDCKEFYSRKTFITYIGVRVFNVRIQGHNTSEREYPKTTAYKSSRNC